MAEPYSLQRDLDNVRQQLAAIQKTLDNDELSDIKDSALRNEKVALLTEKARLEEKLEKALHPIAPTAPQGNSITFPQFLPYSSIAFPFSLFPPPVPP